MGDETIIVALETQKIDLRSSLLAFNMQPVKSSVFTVIYAEDSIVLWYRAMVPCYGTAVRYRGMAPRYGTVKGSHKQRENTSVSTTVQSKQGLRDEVRRHTDLRIGAKGISTKDETGPSHRQAWDARMDAASRIFLTNQSTIASETAKRGTPRNGNIEE